MKKIIASLAMAALGTGFALSANAQTVGSNPAGTYSVNINESSAPSGANFLYTYVATIASTSNTAAQVNNFTFGFPVPGRFIPGSETATGDFAGNLSESSALNSFSFSAPVGLTTGSGGETSATFTYLSTLPPVNNALNITPSASAPGGTGAGVGNTFRGPGVNIPETNSFALLGLGLLPLALVARRRLARKN